jgi:hypothetical protein
VTDADERVARYILKCYREETTHSHLANCPDTIIAETEIEPGLPCWTGGTGVIFTALLRCPHETEEYEWTEEGRLSEVINEL